MKRLLTLRPLTAFAFIVGVLTGLPAASAGSPAFNAAVQCMANYSFNGLCNWNNWSQMFQTCGLGRFPALSSQQTMAKVQRGECTWNNWSNFVATLGAGQQQPQQPQQQQAEQVQGPTYWAASVQKNRTSTVKTYNIRIPNGFVEVIERPGWGKRFSQNINGVNYTFIDHELTWHNGGSSPQTGQIRVHTDDRSREQWLHGLPIDPQFHAVLNSLGTPKGSGWHDLRLRILVSTSPTAPNVQVTEAVSILDQYLNRMRELSQQTRPGTYYPDVRVPAALDEFRGQMLAYGNAGRRDPNYRRNHGSETVTDLSTDMVRAKHWNDYRMEPVFKHHAQPPYFDALIPNAALNAAAQFQAEYQAHTRRGGHHGPTNFQGADLSSFGKRVVHFGYPHATEGEASGGSPDPADAPRGWMKSDSHFRPWFNVGTDVRSMGLGIAQGNDGIWYAAAIGGTQP